MLFRKTTYPELEPADYVERACLWLDSETDLGLSCAAQNLRWAFEQILLKHGIEPGQYSQAALRYQATRKDALAINQSYNFYERADVYEFGTGCYLGIPDALFAAYDELAGFIETHGQVLPGAASPGWYQERSTALRALAERLIPHANSRNKLTIFDAPYTLSEKCDSADLEAWLQRFWGPMKITARPLACSAAGQANDNRRAWAQAERAGLDGLSQQVRAALSLSSRVSLHDVPTELVLACLEAGIIDMSLALAVALAKPDQLESDLVTKVECLASVSRFLPEKEQRNLLAEALVVARTVDTAGWRGCVLHPIVRQLPPGAHDLWAEALNIACGMEDEPNRAGSLQVVAEHLPPEAHDLLEKTQAAAGALENQYWRGRTLYAVAKRLPDPEQAAILAMIGSQAVAAIERENAQRAKSDNASATLRRELNELWKPYQGRTGELLTNLATGVKKYGWGYVSVRIPPKAYAVWDQALATARASDRERADGLKALAERMPLENRDLWSHMWEAIRDVGQESTRLYILRGLVERPLPEARPVLAEAWAMASEIGDEYWRTGALRAVADQMPAAERPVVLAEATATARSITNPQWREKALQIVTQTSGREEPSAPLAAVWATRTTSDVQWCRDIACILHTFASASRTHLLNALQTLLPALARLGGAEALRQTAQAIVDTAHTWP